MDRRQHWNDVYRSKAERDVSWFEGRPDVSLRLLDEAGVSTASCVLDVGGGDSHLIECLLARGLTCLAVLDVSAAALERCRLRLGAASNVPTWLEADVTGEWSLPPVDVWHDRAVFHFLVDPADRERYLERLRSTLKAGGTAIIATFAADGPERCSGLPVQRYSAAALAGALGEGFALVGSVAHQHTTPWGSGQSFQYCRFLKR
jgi:SAM-dependent methyltransferase